MTRIRVLNEYFHRVDNSLKVDKKQRYKINKKSIENISHPREALSIGS